MDGMKTQTKIAVMEQLYIEQGMTLQEIGDLFSISRERVRQYLSQSPVYKTFRKNRATMSAENKRIHQSSKSQRISEKIRSAIFDNIVKLGSGCWIWTGSYHKGQDLPRITNSYLQRAYPSAGMYAHRAVWCVVRGEDIPEGDYLKRDPRVCPDKTCVNPDHFYITKNKRDIKTT